MPQLHPLNCEDCRPGVIPRRGFLSNLVKGGTAAGLATSGLAGLSGRAATPSVY